ncbi:hypothetical protein FJY93_04920 [Candidatus Kaiserbacteria bacterium]|nr:hypothetical protein [Candidatus Kaiserbacteria bacterium]
MDQYNEPSRITIEGGEFRRPVQSFQTQTPKIVQWVMRYSGGYIKDEKQAQYVLLGFVAVAIIISFMFLLSGGGGDAEIKAPSGYKIIYPENGPPRLEEGFRP